MRPSVRPTTAWTTSEKTTRATCTSLEHEPRARTLVHMFILSHTSFGSRSESCHQHLHSLPWAHFLESPRLSSSTSTCPSLSSFLPPLALRAVPWARQPDRHGKPVLLRQGEWRRLRRPHLPHRLWAQLQGFQRAQRLIGFLLSYIIPLSDQDIDDATHGKLLTEAQRGQAGYFEPEGVLVSQSVVVVCCVRWIRETWWRKKCRSVNWFWCRKKHVQCSQQVFSKHPSWENGRWIRETRGRKQFQCTD